jgi:hypothetical protein
MKLPRLVQVLAVYYSLSSSGRLTDVAVSSKHVAARRTVVITVRTTMIPVAHVWVLAGVRVATEAGASHGEELSLEGEGDARRC